jgi:hypothetical protein
MLKIALIEILVEELTRSKCRIGCCWAHDIEDCDEVYRDVKAFVKASAEVRGDSAITWGYSRGTENGQGRITIFYKPWVKKLVRKTRNKQLDKTRRAGHE